MKGKYLLTIGFGMILLSGCGGDAEHPFLPTQIPEYRGVESEAIITEGNAQRLIREMFGLAGPFLDGSDTSTLKPEPYNLLFPLALNASSERINDQSLSDLITNTFNASNFSDQLSCDLGSLDYFVSIDILTGEFSGFITYKDCRVSGLTLAGTTDITGIYDRPAQRFTQITFDFTFLTAEAGDMNYLVTGSVDTQFDDTTLTTNTTLRDYAVIIDDRETVKFEIFSLEQQGADPNRTLALSGRFYQPDNGFVTVSNALPLLFTVDNVWPLQGQTLMDGADSALRVETEDNTRLFTYWIDLDGDGDEDIVTQGEW